jgi:hypothetical protein
MTKRLPGPAIDVADLCRTPDRVRELLVEYQTCDRARTRHVENLFELLSNDDTGTGSFSEHLKHYPALMGELRSILASWVDRGNAITLLRSGQIERILAGEPPGAPTANKLN